jgi:hypothetical protein
MILPDFYTLHFLPESEQKHPRVEKNLPLEETEPKHPQEHTYRP